MRVLGVDPDLHHAGIALVDDGCKVIAVRCPLVSGDLRGAGACVEMARAMQADLFELFAAYGRPDVAIVEGQEMYLGSRVRPQDLLHLALSAGIAAGIVRAAWDDTRIEIPKPKTWKGDIPKHVHQKRVLRSVGIPFVAGSNPVKMVAVPKIEGFAGIRPSRLTHVIDAIGLAVWGSTL